MIGIIGLSHKSAPLEVRERYAFDGNDINSLTQCILADSEVDEIVVLSTCNRTELYFSTQSKCIKGTMKRIDHCLHDFGHLEASYKAYFYHYFDNRAVSHLFRLVSGLESMVIGEYQIVSQIKEALNRAMQNRSSGKMLTRLFTKALEVGKLVRTQTGISRGAFSVSYAAVEKCREHFSNLELRKILLIGAGETGELVVKNLHKRGCQNITIANRTPQKGQLLAQRFQAAAIPFSQLSQAIRDSEIVISSITGEHVIDRSLLNEEPFIHKVMMIDLGVPRNISPDLAGIEHVKLLNIDDLKRVVVQNEEKKKSYFDTALKIIEEKLKEFDDWLMGQKLSPAIKHIISSVRQINQEGLHAFGASFSEQELETMEQYGNHLSERMIRTLIKNLKATTDNGRKEDVVQVVNRLFDKE
jgi:glutamyl-tRNA reductase